MNSKSLLFIFLLALTFLGRGQDNGTKMNSKEIKLLVDSLSAALKRWYIYPDKAELISKAIKDKYKMGTYNRLQNRAQVAEAMKADARKTHYDGHMRIMYSPELEKMLLTVLPDSLQKKEDEMEIGYERSNNFYFVKTEVMPGNIGYIRWDEFAEHTKEAQLTYEAAFKFASNTKALIIDMRYCRGGWPPTVNAMLNYFFDKKLSMNHIISYKHDTVKNYTDPTVTAFTLNMPVYILTSKPTFSGAEDFTYAMKVAGRAVVVGDTTGGGAHPVETVALGQGFVLRIPNARSYNEVTGTDWEGTGVYPDVHVKSEYALEKAQVLIFKDFLAKAADDDEKQQARGLVIAAENKLVLAQNGSMNF
jgi:retinol-binding protein 3